MIRRRPQVGAISAVKLEPVPRAICSHIQLILLFTLMDPLVSLLP